MTAHARLGPSSLKACKLCPKRVVVNERHPQKPSEAAAEGTVIHDVLAAALDLDMELSDFIGEKYTVDGFEFVVDEDMVGPFEKAIDWVRDQPGTLYTECRVSLDAYMPGQFGTLDVCIVQGRRGIFVDWKAGRGINVPVVGNYQVRAYAIGFIDTYLKPKGIELDEIVLIIEQPRLAGAPRFWEPWVITYDELMEFGDEMRAIYAAATDPNAKAVAGSEQCTFCGGAEPGKCEAYDEFNYALAQTYFDDDDVADDVPPSPRSNLTPERRSYLIRNGAMLNSYIKQLEEQAVIDALHGNAPPGLKAIDGSEGNRAWSDPAKVEKMLVAAFADDAFTKKLLGPAGVEKLAVPTRKKPGNPELWKDLQELIFRPPGKPQLVLASDPRPAKILAESLLDEEDDDLIGD